MFLRGGKKRTRNLSLSKISYLQLDKILLFILVLTTFFMGLYFEKSHEIHSITDLEVVSGDSEGCTFTSTVSSAHTKTVTPGTTQSDIGTTKITTKCVNSTDHQVYAIGYSNDTDGNTNLINSANNETIATGTATSGNVSNWAMKVAKDTNSYEPSNLTITNSFGSYHVVPSSATQVSSYTGATDSSTGSSITTTYRAKSSDYQTAGTYVGKVKYTLTATMVYNITIKTVTGVSKVTLNGVECTSTSGCVVSGLTEGESYTLVATLATGYNFTSWNAGTNGSVASTSSASTTYTVGGGDSIITPSTTPKTYTITLNGNGATTPGSSSTTATYNSSTLAAITRPERAYAISGFTLPASNNASSASVSSTSTLTSTYTFNGWYKESGATNKIANNAATPVLMANTSYTNASAGWTYNGARTLYAGWTAQEKTLPTITRDGYECGWTETATNATTITYQSGDPLTPDKNYTLYGVCVPIDYTITIHVGNGATAVNLTGWTGTGTGTLTKTYHIGDTIDLSDATLTYKTGYNGSKITKNDSYGSLSESTYTVGAGNGDITIGASALDTPVCTVSGGSGNIVHNYVDTTITATSNASNYDSSSVNITYSFGYGSSSSNTLGNFSSAQSGNTYTIARNAYKGTRYYGVKVVVTDKTDNTITATCTSGTGTGTGSTVAARTTVGRVNSIIRFDATSNGGTLSGTTPLYVSYLGTATYTSRTNSTTAAIPTAVPPTGYTFDGWYTEQTGGSKVLNSSNQLTGIAVSGWSNADSQWVKTSANISNETINFLYAQYAPKTYTVTLNGNGATTAGSPSTTATYGSTTLSSITKPFRSYTVSGFTLPSSNNASGASVSSSSTVTSSYTFSGWYEESSTTNLVASNDTTPVLQASTTYTDASGQWNNDGVATLYAGWTPQEITLPTITRSGYACGWTESSSGATSITYPSGSKLTPDQNYTLFGVCIPAIQNLPSSSCTTTAATFGDVRDGRMYTVKRLNDGNCWMMENLDLGRTELTVDLTSANTNLTTTVTANTFNSWKKTSGSVTYNAGEFISVSGSDSTSGNAYGTLYNYYAASAGTITGSSNSNNAVSDICPAGWRLPIGNPDTGEFKTLNSNSSYNTLAKMRASEANGGAAFALAGHFASSYPTSQASGGHYWSSTVSSNTEMHKLFLTTAIVNVNSPNSRANGYSIRCILKRPSYTLTVSYGTGVSSVKVNNITVQNGGTMTIEQGIPYEITMTPATGYNFGSWSATSGTVGSTGTQTTTYAIGSSNATLTANGSPKTYTITLNDNGATTAGSPTTTVTYKSTTLATITKPQINYTISGFTTTNNNAADADVSSTSTITSSYTLTGWYKEAATTHKIASDSNIPALVTSTDYTNSASEWTYDGEVTLYAGWTPQQKTLPTITKPGYDCGWTETESGATSITYQSGDPLTPGRNYTLYGVCTAIDYTVTVNAGAGISTLALSGWTGTGTGMLTKTFHIGDTIDISTFTPTYKTGHSGSAYVVNDSYGSLSTTTYTVGAGNGNITIKATTLATPTCVVKGGTTKVYNRTATTLTATNQSSLYESNSVNLTYSFGYASSSSATLGNFGEPQASNTISIEKNAYRGTRYYGVTIVATSVDDSSLTATCTSGTGTSVRAGLVLVNSRVQLNTGNGALIGTTYFYVSYQDSTKYSSRTTDAAYTLPTVTPPSGYTLDGWYTAAEGGSKVMNADFSLTGTAVSGWSDSSGRWVKTGTSNSATATANQLYAQYTYTFNGPDIQNLNTSLCTTTASTAKDVRDGHIYAIQRLADGNCWMMENLDLGRTTLTTDLTSANTNLVTTITATTFNDWKKTTSTANVTGGEFINISGVDSTSGTPFGTLYNYFAASAGTISGSSNRNNASFDICPAGWRLPAGGSYGEFQGLYSEYNSPSLMLSPIGNGGAAFARAGAFHYGTPDFQNVYGYYWSSTRNDNTRMENISVTASDVNPSDRHDRIDGISIRCILKRPTHTLTVSYGTGVSSVTVNNITVQNGGTLILEEGFPYTIDMTSATGYAFSSWSATSGVVGSTSTKETIYAIGSSNATLIANASFSGPNIQNLASSSCTSTASQAIDTRDNQLYTIQRLDDGNCWMMDNLNLGATSLTNDLTSSNTNISATVSASTFNGWLKTAGTETRTAGEFIPVSGTDSTSGSLNGVLYNYYAASAGTVAGASNSSNALYDICPAGWRLPSGGVAGEFKTLYNNSSYNTFAKMTAPIANSGAAFAVPGRFTDDVPSGQGDEAGYWSGTVYNTTSMSRLAFLYSMVGADSSADRYTGYSIRCILKRSTHTLTVAYGTGVSSVKVNNITIQNGGTLTLEEGVSYAIDMTPTTGYAFSSWSATSGIVGSTSTKTTAYAIGSSNATLTANASFSGPNIQNLTSSSCTSTASQAIDTRDNRVYTIQRLNDGNCWIMENLDLGRTTLTTDLTSANTNLSTTVTASTFNGWKKTSGSRTYIAGEFVSVSGIDATSGTSYGTLYNFYAASAGTISGENNSNDSEYDICPAGWRLPTGGSSGEFQALYAQYNSSALMRASVENGGAAFALAGFFWGMAPDSLGSIGFYWSSTVYNNTNMYYQSIDTSDVNPANNNYRSFGLSIRCVLKEPKTIAKLTYLQDFKDLSETEYSSVLNSMASNTTYNLTDNRDNKSYAIAKLADGSIWMAENLDLGRTTLTTDLTSTNTNVATTVTAATFNGWKTDTGTSSYTTGEFINLDGTDSNSNTAYGTLYNYHVASAGTVTGATYDGDAHYDICPAGWRLPTGSSYGEVNGLLTAYNSMAATLRTPVASGGASIALGGYFTNSTPTYQGQTGYLWTSTAKSNTSMYRLFTGSSANVTNNAARSTGSSIRCIAKKPTSTLTVSYGASVSSVKVNGTTVSNGGTIALERGVNASIEATMASGYVFTSWTATSGTVADSTVGSSYYAIGNNNATLTAAGTYVSTTIQNIAQSSCTSTASYARDTRDGQVYRIQRLADGNCWMMENLNLGATDISTNLTKQNTNLVTTIPASTFNSWRVTSGTSSYTVGEFINSPGTDATSLNKYGVLYNFYAASAGTVSGTSYASNAQYDICPAGWRLPTGGTGGEFETLYANSSYNTYAKMRAPVASSGAAFALAGYIYTGSTTLSGSYGYYWSSTRSAAGSMYSIYFTSSAVTASSARTRFYKQSVRCVRKNNTVNSISELTYMQDFRNLTDDDISAVFASMSDSTIYTLTDNRDNKQYSIAALEDGNIWMAQSLDLGRTTLSTNLTSSNTNLSTTITASTFNGWKTTTGVETNTTGKFMLLTGTDSTSLNAYGTLYNYYAASAGTISGSTNSSDARYDICPAGWRLPTGGSTGEFTQLKNAKYDTPELLRAPITNGGAAFAFAGRFYSSSVEELGTGGYYWSSTYGGNDTYMYYFRLGSTYGYISNDGQRTSGRSIRCIVKGITEPLTIADMNYLQDFADLSADDKTSVIDSMTFGTNYTLPDRRDNQTYTITKINGNAWMTRNLAIGCNGSASTYGSSMSSKSLTSTYSNVSTSFSTPTTDLSTCASYDTACMACDSTYGAWYNYAAASAGTVTGTSNTTEDVYNICPKGWTLPSQAQFNAMTGYTAYYSPVAGGEWLSKQIVNSGSAGYWWSSTASDALYRYYLVYWGGALTTPVGYGRFAGVHVRCVLK
ncbi:hypothetical protein IJI89_01870 [Candidatus Saccharibacteria bacterium]|nr:hypothetical protein [Candidatus Saccharibacteria bacterium]